MAKTKDILSKVWLRRGSNGILSRALCGGNIAAHLPTEQPQISNRQVDMLVENDQGLAHQVEFQGTNEPDFEFRMLEYWVYWRREGKRVVQTVFYIGEAPMRLQPCFREAHPSGLETVHPFTIVNLQDFTAEELLASGDWGDNLWALGARGAKENRPVVLRQVLAKLVALPRAEHPFALAELTAYSGILKADELLSENLKEYPMLNSDLRENALVRPLIQEGRQEGRRQTVITLLREKFGALPDWATERVGQADEADLDRWVRAALRESTLEATLS